MVEVVLTSRTAFLSGRSHRGPWLLLFVCLLLCNVKGQPEREPYYHAETLISLPSVRRRIYSGQSFYFHSCMQTGTRTEVQLDAKAKF